MNVLSFWVVRSKKVCWLLTIFFFSSKTLITWTIMCIAVILASWCKSSDYYLLETVCGFMEYVWHYVDKNFFLIIYFEHTCLFLLSLHRKLQIDLIHRLNLVGSFPQYTSKKRVDRSLAVYLLHDRCDKRLLLIIIS